MLTVLYLLTVHPGCRADRDGSDSRVLAGSMNGSLSVLDGASGDVICTAAVHTKYLVRALWAGDGCTVATCSHDQTVGVLRVEGSSLTIVKQVGQVD
jgi:hypothetical protein